MTSLREQFDEAATTTGPPSRLSGAELYQRAWRRRRARNRLAAAVGCCTAAVVAAVAVLITAGGPHLGTTPGAPAASPTARQGQYGGDDVMDVAATDPNHLYAVRKGVLYGSDDGGRTWTVRQRTFGTSIEAPAPGVIGAVFLVVDRSAQPQSPSWPYRFSTDGGRTWTEVQSRSGTMPAVPTGGWATCLKDNNQPGVQCALYGVDVRTGAMNKLANQPPSIAPTGVNDVPAGAGLWVSGVVSGLDRTGVSVSHDSGRTWSTHVLGQGEADYPQGTVDQSVRVATIDGTTAYAVVSATSREYERRLLVFRTTDAGKTWQRADPGNTLPRMRDLYSAISFVAADGTHVLQSVVHGQAQWYAGTTGAYTKPASMSGLEGVDLIRQSVKNEAVGAYIFCDRIAVYTSPDGLHWTRHPLKVS